MASHYMVDPTAWLLASDEEKLRAYSDPDVRRKLHQEVVEWVAFELLDTQGNALALDIDCQHDGFQFVAFLELANSFFASVGPGQVG